MQPSITGQPFQSDVAIRYEFDFSSSLLRIEWQEQVQEVHLGEKANIEGMNAEKLRDLAKLAKMQVLPREFKYIHTPKYSLHWKSNEEGIVFQHSPEHETEQIMQRFDIRALGFMGSYDFENGSMLGPMGKNLLQQKIVDCSKVSGAADSNLQRITWVFGPNENWRREIVIDQNRGYTPLHFAVRQSALSDNAQKETPPIETVDVTWKELSGAWVPATYVQRAFSGGKIDSQLELTFDWDLANAKLDAGDFTIERLDPSTKAQVISDQSGQRVLVGYAYPKGQGPKDAEKVDTLRTQEPGKRGPHPLLGVKVPDCKLTLLEGGAQNLADLKDKKVVVIDFWTLWCGPCVRALPKVDQVATKFADLDVSFFAVNLGDETDKIREFLEKQKLRLPIAVDPKSELSKLFQADSLPMMVIIDKQGLVQVVNIGYGDDLEQTLSDKIEAVLAGKQLADETLKAAHGAQ